STSPGGDFFIRLRALDLWQIGYRATTLPRAVGLTADSIALMANGPGAARSSLTDLTGNFLIFAPPPMQSVIGDSLQIEAPLVLSLGARPNPALSSTMVRFTLPRTTHVELGVFDVQGRRIRSLVNSQVWAGVH